MVIKIDISTNKPIKIKKNDNNSVYIYENKIDNIELIVNLRILVKNQISYYLNNIYVIKSKIKDGFLCNILTNIELNNEERKSLNKTNIINSRYLIKSGNINKNKIFVKDKNNLNNKFILDKTNNIKKIIMVNNSFSSNNNNKYKLNRLYSIHFYLYYFKTINNFNKLYDNNIIYTLDNNTVLNKNKIILSKNKKYFLTINDKGYLVLYNNNYNNINLNTVKWYYYCSSLKNNTMLFDNLNNLIVTKKNGEKEIINNKSYKYKGLLVNQGPKFSNLIYRGQQVTLPDEIELFENDIGEQLYINPKKNKIISKLQFNKYDAIPRKLRILNKPNYKNILSESFRDSLNIIIQTINKNKISDLKPFITNFIKDNIDIKNELIKFNDKTEDDANKLSKDNLNTYVNIIINHINNNTHYISPIYYIFDITNEDKTSGRFPSQLLDNNKKQTKRFFKLQEIPNHILTKHSITINNNGNIAQTINNININIWEQNSTKTYICNSGKKINNKVKKDKTLLDLYNKNLKQNTYLDFPLISTNYISSDYIQNDIMLNRTIIYDSEEHYILINNNDFKINTYLKQNNTYTIYFVHSIPNIENYTINDILNIKSSLNKNKILINEYSINNILSEKNIQKYEKENKNDINFISNRSHITYISFTVLDDLYEINIFKNINNLYNFNLHQILIFSNLDFKISEKINIFKYLNKQWSIYLNKNNNYDNTAHEYIYYNDKLICNISCFDLDKYKNNNNIYNKINDTFTNINTNLIININYNFNNLDELFNYVKDELYNNDIYKKELESNIYKFIRTKIIPLKNLDFKNNLLYQFKHFLPYIYINGKPINVKELHIYNKTYNISKEQISFILPNNLYNINFIILLINQTNKNKNGLYIRNKNNTITKLILNMKKYSNKIFNYTDNFINLNMSNIILNKLQNSNLYFKLYEKKFNTPISLNFNDYTKDKTNKSDICFNNFMNDYINTYYKKELLFVDLATTKIFDIHKKKINIINLPDILKENCISCNIYNFLKIKKNILYILIKNQKNKSENGIYKYKFKNNNILEKQYKLLFNNCSNILIYILNGIENKNSLYKYDNNNFTYFKKYIYNATDNNCKIK